MGDIFLFLDANPWVFIVFFAIFQLIAFISTILKLEKMKEFFSKSQNWRVEDRENGHTILVTNSSDGLTELVDQINVYLDKNKGTTDFGIIKDKVQNRLEALYEDATSKVSFPTYIGLMGTFFGVWIGLQSFRIGVDKTGVSDEIVSALIGGIIVSMATSLVGLVLMILGNWMAGSVQKKVNYDKNKFFDFIQVRLMPVLGTSIVSALNKLHTTINEFEPAFKSVISDFKDAFKECTEMLRGTFGEKVQILTTAVDTMGKNMTLINDNVRMQERLIDRLQQRETLRTLESFVAAANKFDAVTTSIAQLSEITESLAGSSAKLVEAQVVLIDKMNIPQKIFERINAILDRIVNFEASINDLGTSISQTQMLGNHEMNLIHAQIDAITRKTRIIDSYLEHADEDLTNIFNAHENAISQLNDRYRAEIDSLGSDFAKSMSDFRTAYEQVMTDCTDAVAAKRSEYIDEIRKSLDLEAYDQRLAHLSRIPEILAILSNIQSSVMVQPEVSSKINVISDQINGVKSTLDSMEEKFDRKQTFSRRTSDVPRKPYKNRIWPFNMFHP